MWILTGTDVSVPVSVFVLRKLGHFTGEVTGFVSDVLQEKIKSSLFKSSIRLIQTLN